MYQQYYIRLHMAVNELTPRPCHFALWQLRLAPRDTIRAGYLSPTSKSERRLFPHHFLREDTSSSKDFPVDEICQQRT